MENWQRARNRNRYRTSILCPKIRAMSEIVHVTEVEALGAHRLRLRFEDGVEGEIDFSTEAWDGVFAPLSDPTYFARVELDEGLGTIVWPNGADVAPEALHQWVAEHVAQVPA
jgi:hypothetical protein